MSMNHVVKALLLCLGCAVVPNGALAAPATGAPPSQNGEPPLIWSELPELPPAAGAKVQPGLAGAFAGVHKDGLILAGGANFPDGLPWSTLADGSNPKKIYHKDIYVLLKDGDTYTWTIADATLAHGYSYGVSIPTDEGLLCIGGEWREYEEDGVKRSTSDKVFLIAHLGEGKVKIGESYRGKPLPDLPEAVSAMAGAIVADTVYIAGGNNG